MPRPAGQQRERRRTGQPKRSVAVVATDLGLPGVDLSKIASLHRPADQLIVGDTTFIEIGLGVHAASLVAEGDDQDPVSRLEQGLANQGEEARMAGDRVVDVEGDDHGVDSSARFHLHRLQSRLAGRKTRLRAKKEPTSGKVTKKVFWVQLPLE